MKEDISVSEYRKLLVGLNGETPLGYVVSVRSEKDTERIKNMTNKELEIREKWNSFKAEKFGDVSQFTMSVSELQQMFKSLAGVR